MNETDYCQSCWSRELDSGGRCMRCGWTPCLVETGPIKTTYIGHEMVRRIEEYYEKARVKAEHERDAARKKAERERDELRKALSDLTAPTPETESSAWVEKVRKLATELGAVDLKLAQLVPNLSSVLDDHFSRMVADERDRLSGVAKRLEAEIVIAAVDGCREEGSHE